MADIEVKLDLSGIFAQTKRLTDDLESKIAVSAQHLAVQTHAHIQDEAQRKLRSRLEIFTQHLHFESTQDGGIITVGKEARWIEDGVEPHSMLEDLLKSPKAKQAKDGSKYLIVPFKHSEAPSRQSPVQAELNASLRSALKSKGIPYKKIERNPDGSPKVGLLHSMDLYGPKRARVPEGAHGPIGRPYATHSLGHSTQQGPEGRPYLWGVRIYQRAEKNPDGSPRLGKDGKQSASRDIFTFRVASSKQTNKWFHPGTAPMHFFDDAHQWASHQWDEVIAPQIIRELQTTHGQGNK